MRMPRGRELRKLVRDAPLILRTFLVVVAMDVRNKGPRFHGVTAPPWLVLVRLKHILTNGQQVGKRTDHLRISHEPGSLTRTRGAAGETRGRPGPGSPGRWDACPGAARQSLGSGRADRHQRHMLTPTPRRRAYAGQGAAASGSLPDSRNRESR